MASEISSFEELAHQYGDGQDPANYPGSKQKRRGVVESKAAPSSDEDSDDPLAGVEPRVMSVDGVEREFFTIGALADLLNRKVQTLRIWERKGYMPAATYRSPGKKQDRLYTRRQVLGLLALAKEEGLMEPWKKKRIDQTDFPGRSARLFEALKKAGR